MTKMRDMRMMFPNTGPATRHRLADFANKYSEPEVFYLRTFSLRDDDDEGTPMGPYRVGTDGKIRSFK